MSKEKTMEIGGIEYREVENARGCRGCAFAIAFAQCKVASKKGISIFGDDCDARKVIYKAASTRN